MHKNNTLILVTLGVLILAGTLWWDRIDFSRKTDIPVKNEEAENKEDSGNTVETPVDINILKGTLWNSDDEERGNLMLVSSDNVIYIKTSRDFSHLIGQKVYVDVEGYLESFTLLDIQPRIEEDGYLIN